MRSRRTAALVLGCMAGMIWSGPPAALSNGGPFLLKYPAGDTSAKGVLARLDPSLLPARETRLSVVGENLSIGFLTESFGRATDAPLARVVAEYVIENPTDEEIELDLGFPILRGIYLNPLSMAIRPDVWVTVDGAGIPVDVISNSILYGILRQRARDGIATAMRKDPTLRRLTGATATRSDAARSNAEAALKRYLVKTKRWSPRDAALFAAYSRLDLEKPPVVVPHDGTVLRSIPDQQVARENLGPLAAIGEQKATQLLAHIVSLFAPKTAITYESMFTAWGGDVLETSVDLRTGRRRPREITLPPETTPDARRSVLLAGDPTIYARIDYLDPGAPLNDFERTACRDILKNLPVVFTFAPMNLLRYQVHFPPNSKRIVKVGYQQYAYIDTADPESYQVAYVVHPASLWKHFGPIRLEVMVPYGVPFKASVPCPYTGPEERSIDDWPGGHIDLGRKRRFAMYRTTLLRRTGEIVLGIDAAGWRSKVEFPGGDGKDAPVPSVPSPKPSISSPE